MRRQVISAACALLVGAAACSDGTTGTGSARFSVAITDAADTLLASAVVHIGEVQLLPEDGPPIVVATEGGTFDLLTLQNGVTATVGKPVKRGQVLGFIGMTGFTSRPHVHFHVKKNGDYHAGTEWATVPFVFKSKTREGLVVKTGCWYRNDESGLAVKTGTMQKAVAVKKK